MANVTGVEGGLSLAVVDWGERRLSAAVCLGTRAFGASVDTLSTDLVGSEVEAWFADFASACCVVLLAAWNGAEGRSGAVSGVGTRALLAARDTCDALFLV